MIYIPKALGVETDFKNTVSGEYTFIRTKADSGLVVQELKCKNLFTTQGLNGIAVTPTLFPSHIMLGTGTAAPTLADTQMGNLGVFKSTPALVTGNGVAPDYVTPATTQVTFNPGEATGTWTEVGWGYFTPNTSNPAANNRVTSRALIVDSSGLPLAITVLPDEYLTVVYTTYHHFTVNDITYSITIAGTSYTVTQRPARVTLGSVWGWYAYGGRQTAHTQVGIGNSAFTLAPITSSPGVAQGYSNNYADDAYVMNSFTKTGTLTIPPASANAAGGIKGLYFLWTYNYFPILGERQLLFSSPIPKDATKALTLKTQISWANYTP